MNHIVMFSGGLSSWMTAKRVAEKYGTKNLKLLFCDTKIEDEDLYRFLDDASENVGAELVKISDGRTPFEVFKDVKFMGNNRVDPCSRILKRELADKWIADNYTPDTVIVYVGIEWTEIHRYERMAPRKLPWIYKAPLCDTPVVTKPEIVQEAQKAGIKVPRLYNLGFPHNNCGGFCIRAGQAQFKLLYESMPERYRWMEDQEQEVFEVLGKPHPFLKTQKNKKVRYMSLKEFREEIIEAKDPFCLLDSFDWGGCGCFVDNQEE